MRRQGRACDACNLSTLKYLSLINVYKPTSIGIRRLEVREFFEQLFSSDFMAHGYCYLWKPDIVWLHAISDALIAFPTL